MLLGILLLSVQLHAAGANVAPRIAALLQQQGLDGAVWTTLDAQGAAGVSDARSGEPMRADARVQVGSVAKAVLATGVLRLVSERRLSLDARVAALLPGVAFDNPWENTDPLRVRHLLDHTSGLDDARFWQVFSLRPRADGPLAAAFPPESGLLRLRHRPGTRFSYSNMGYTLLAMVVEAVVEQAYERYFDAALLAPLGMHDSSFAFVSQDSDPRLAMGHVEHGETHPAVPSWVRPAGQFTTTAADMGRFARFLMSDGSIGGKPFIDAVLLHRMGEPKGTEAARAGLSVGYGLGLRKVDRHGALAKCHSGNTIGFRATLCLFPQTQQAFFIAINADSETADYHRFDAALVQALGRAGPAPPASPAPRFDSRGWEGFYIPSPNRFDSMRFVDTVFNAVHVRSDGAQLRFAPFQSAAVALDHAGKGLFRAPGKLMPSHVLLISAQGERIISTGTQSYAQVPLMRLLPLWTSMAAGMLGLAFILVSATVRVARRSMPLHDPLLAPFAGVLALLLPLPFFYTQSFLQLGDLTMASGLLATVTGALPLAMLVGMGEMWRRRKLDKAVLAALVAVLQLAAVLAAWGLLPLRLWA